MFRIFFLFLLIKMFSPPQLSCVKTTGTIHIDGKLNEKSWANSQTIFLEDHDHRTKNSVTFKSVWDEENLYLSFNVKDANLVAHQNVLDHPLLYMDDMVEFLIDANNEKDSCWGINDLIYHINLLGQKKDDRGSVTCLTDPSWNGDAKYGITMLGTLNKCDDEDIGYTVEISISWRELKISPHSGISLGLNFANGDNGKLYDWVDASPFRSPYAFGTLTLVN
jgi:hypothetical protein